MNEEKLVKTIEEALARQLVPLYAKVSEMHQVQQQHSEILGQHSEILGQHSEILGQHSKILGQHSEELSEIRATQDEHTRLLTTIANAISVHGDKLIDLSHRVSVLERKVG